MLSHSNTGYRARMPCNKIYNSLKPQTGLKWPWEIRGNLTRLRNFSKRLKKKHDRLVNFLPSGGNKENLRPERSRRTLIGVLWRKWSEKLFFSRLLYNFNKSLQQNLNLRQNKSSWKLRLTEKPQLDWHVRKHKNSKCHIFIALWPFSKQNL